MGGGGQAGGRAQLGVGQQGDTACVRAAGDRTYWYDPGNDKVHVLAEAAGGGAGDVEVGTVAALSVKLLGLDGACECGGRQEHDRPAVVVPHCGAPTSWRPCMIWPGVRVLLGLWRLARGDDGQMGWEGVAHLNMADLELYLHFKHRHLLRKQLFLRQRPRNQDPDLFHQLPYNTKAFPGKTRHCNLNQLSADFESFHHPFTVPRFHLQRGVLLQRGSAIYQFLGPVAVLALT